MTIEEFKKKYGTRGLSLLIGRFVDSSPRFRGDEALSKTIAEICAELESALEQVGSK